MLEPSRNLLWTISLSIACWLVVSSFARSFAQDSSQATAPEEAPPPTPASDPPALNRDAEVASDFLKQMQEQLTASIRKTEGSVVAIARVRRETQPRVEAFRLPLGADMRFAEMNRPTDPDFVPAEYSTGVVVDEQGFIATCFSSLSDPRASDYYVWSAKHSTEAQVVWLPAEVQAGDPFSNIAILKVPNANLTAMTFGKEVKVQKGQLAFALGNPYATSRDGSPTAAWGIIANTDRSLAGNPGQTTLPQEKESLHHFGGLLQIDAQLGPGFNGGPVLDLEGRMIGLLLPTAVLPTEVVTGGFAIPVDSTFVRVIESLKQGKIPEFGFLGIVPEEIPARLREPSVQGAYVSRVVPGLPGDLAGLRGDDIISAVGETKVFDRNSLFLALSRHGAEEQIDLTVLRQSRFGGFPETLILRGQLSKKYIASSIPPYTILPKTNWRGLSVEYATALPTEMLRFMSRSLATPPKLAALQVEPNTPAWQAGIRPGQLIMAVEQEFVANPDQFTEMVNRFPDQPVEITLLDATDTLRKIIVPQ